VPAGLNSERPRHRKVDATVPGGGVPAKLTACQRTALELIKAYPEQMAWPAAFGRLFWPDWGKRTNPDGTVWHHERRNKVNAPTMHYRAAGYLGKLRKAGLITGGMYILGDIGREPLYLTKLAEDLLIKAQADQAAKRPQTVGHAAEERLQFGR
jgi:hypothetical protein